MAARTQCDSGALEEGDLLMTSGDSKKKSQHLRSLKDEAMKFSVKEKRFMRLSLRFFRSHLLAFYLTSFFCPKFCFTVLQRTFSPGSCCQQLSWFAVIPYPYLFPQETLLQHCSICDFIIHKCSSFCRDYISYQWCTCGGISTKLYYIVLASFMTLSKGNIHWVGLKNMNVNLATFVCIAEV